MEKFSAFRDPGTGIQPFLPPVPPHGSSLATALLPLAVLLGILRTVLVVLLVAIWTLLVQVVCLPFLVIPPLHRGIAYGFSAILSRLLLLVLGFWWIPVEVVYKKRGRNWPGAETWSPGAGDIIISNWSSWIELLWLTFRFNPTFILPIAHAPSPSLAASSSSAPSPGRRTGTGSAAISTPQTSTPQPRAPIQGFRKVSLFEMIRATGQVPPFGITPQETRHVASSLEEIRKSAPGPVVVFPECTTSNGRGLLRFADVFGNSNLPITKYQVFLMCVRYDPPSPTSHTSTLSIPSASNLGPWRHLISLTSSLSLSRAISIRLQAPSESPSSGAFVVSDVLAGGLPDELSEASAVLIAQLGKLKRTGQGWEEKVAFLEFFDKKTK